MDRRIERRWHQKRPLRWALGVGLATLLLSWLAFSEAGRSEHAVRTNYLTIATVRKGPFSEYIAVTGTVQPIRTVYLDAVAGGRVEEVMREAGTQVTAGDEILRLSNAALVLDIMQREAQLFEQRNNLRVSRLEMQRYSLDLENHLLDLERRIEGAERSYQRNRELRDLDMVSLDEFTDARQEYEHVLAKRDLLLRMKEQDARFRGQQITMLEDSVARLQANLEFIQGNLEELCLRAPVSGLLTFLDAEVGELKSQGERLGRIDILDGFKVRAEVDEYYITRMSIGLTGSFELAGRTYRLRVTKLYPEVTEGRFSVDMQFVDEVPEDVRRGQTLRVRVQLGDPVETVLVPQGGFYSTTGGHWIFVVDEERKTAVRRAIRLGRKNPKAFEVLEGLTPGERVIVSAYDDLADVQQLVLRD